MTTAARLLISMGIIGATLVGEDVQSINKLKSVFSRNKNADVTQVSQVAGALRTVEGLLQAISTNIDGFARKNWSGEMDISFLMAYRIFTKNAAEFLGWMQVLSNAVQTGYAAWDKAQTTIDSGRGSQRSQDRAAQSQGLASQKLESAIANMTGPGIEAVIANLKASAIICVKIMSHLEFSTANIDALRKNQSNVQTKSGTLSAAMNTFAQSIQNICNTSGIEYDDSKIKNQSETIALLIDLLGLVERYFQAGAQLDQNEAQQYINRCALSNNQAEGQGYNMQGAYPQQAAQSYDGYNSAGMYPNQGYGGGDQYGQPNYYDGGNQYGQPNYYDGGDNGMYDNAAQGGAQYGQNGRRSMMPAQAIRQQGRR